MKVNEILRTLRLKRKLSLQNIADELDIAYSTYQGYEAEEESKIQINTLEQIAKFHKMTLQELINYSDDPNGNIVYEPFAPPISKSKGKGLKVIIELDGMPETLKAWFGKLERINSSLL